MLLSWDSEFWGVRIGRVEGDDLDAKRVDAWARENGVACLYYLAGDVAGAEDAGFRLVDVRVELARQAAGGDVGAVRPAGPGDEPVLRRIAREAHSGTRFFADPHFPDERCRDLYETWIARSLEGWADAVLVAEAGAGPAGYVAVDGTGALTLVAVDPSSRGQGLGQELVRGGVAWCRERGLETVTVATQARNIEALRTYERCGFVTTAVRPWFHKWYDR
jgi:dTDP-4-amino-4,6-dideoxy-D-galactose acyltransferase